MKNYIYIMSLIFFCIPILIKAETQTVSRKFSHYKDDNSGAMKTDFYNWNNTTNKYDKLITTNDGDKFTFNKYSGAIQDLDTIKITLQLTIRNNQMQDNYGVILDSDGSATGTETGFVDYGVKQTIQISFANSTQNAEVGLKTTEEKYDLGDWTDYHNKYGFLQDSTTIDINNETEINNYVGSGTFNVMLTVGEYFNIDNNSISHDAVSAGVTSISVEYVSSVPEPTTFTLFTMVIIATILRRKR